MKRINKDDTAAAFSAWTPAFNEFMETYAKNEGLKTALIPDTGEMWIEKRPNSDDWEKF